MQVNEKAGRYYEITGVGKFVSVTTVLKCLDKPAIYVWAKKNALTTFVDTVRDFIRQKGIDILWENLDELVEVSLKRVDKKQSDIMDIGSTIHKLIEEYHSGRKFKLSELRKMIPVIRNGLLEYVKWFKESGYVLEKSESVVYHEGLGYAGTLDLLYFNPKTKCYILGDIKTGQDQRCYQEMWLQTTAYLYAFAYTNARMPQVFEDQIILKYDKKKMKLKAHKLSEQKENRKEYLFEIFKSCIKIFHWRYPQ